MKQNRQNPQIPSLKQKQSTLYKRSCTKGKREKPQITTQWEHGRPEIPGQDQGCTRPRPPGLRQTFLGSRLTSSLLLNGVCSVCSPNPGAHWPLPDSPLPDTRQEAPLPPSSQDLGNQQALTSVQVGKGVQTVNLGSRRRRPMFRETKGPARLQGRNRSSQRTGWGQGQEVLATPSGGGGGH